MEAASQQRSLSRISEIARVATRHGFGYLFERRRNGGRPDSPTDRGRRLRAMLDELGPTFVKFGQLLSTRPDVVPHDIVVELRKLQDDVTPFAFAEVAETIEAELGLTVAQAFVRFDSEPIAAASIGQVHRAVLPDGDEVAVKVQRPNAARRIESDIALMRSAARVVRDRVRALDFIDPEALVDEFARSIRQELDYTVEARNAERFRRDFAGDERVVVPRVIRPYSTGRVLTLEYLEGTQVRDLDTSVRTPEQNRDLAYRMTDAWMAMIFRHGFFHGDPHPSNILVLADDRIGLIDFGLAGALSDDDMARLTRLFVDAATENVEALPRRLAELGVRYEREREPELRAAIDDLFHRYYGARLQDIDPLEVIREGLDLIYRLNLQLPTRFVILDKAIATLGAVGVELYPEFNVFEVARPYARRLLAERFAPGRLAASTQKGARELAGIAHELPYQVRDVLDDVRTGSLTVNISNAGVDDLSHQLEQATNRLAVALVVVGGLVGSSIIGVLGDEGPRVVGLHLLSFVGFLFSGAFGVWLLWGIMRHGRL
jgi:ubiquinone biosynthesis protein